MRYVLAGVVAAGLVLAGTTLTRQDDAARAVHLTPARALEERAAVLPAPAEPAFRVGLPRLIDPNEGRARYAPVRRTVIAVTAPASGAPAVATLPPATEEGTTNVVLAVDEVRRGDGVWVKVRLPVLPNGRTGWVPREALGGYTFVLTHLVVDRSRLTATLFRDGRAVFRAPIGIGVDDAPTPAGRFYVRVKLTGFGDPFYGPVAYGTNARSAVLTDWPGGGYIGIHGTNAPQLIPGRVSHGCVRLRNGDILRLSRLMSVGTPVTIR